MSAVFQYPQKNVKLVTDLQVATGFFYNFLVQLTRALNLFWNGVSFAFKEGANKPMGLSTLVGGTVTVSNTLITANTRIFLSNQGGGVAANVGASYISARVAGTSFTITSNNAADTSTIAWLLIEPQ